MSIPSLISRARSGIVQILIKRDGSNIGGGTGFLVKGGFVTNSHVLRECKGYDVFKMRFDDKDPNDPAEEIRFSADDLERMIAKESLSCDKDFVYLRVDQPEFDGRHRFELADASAVEVGEQVVFLGFPFRLSYLTAHVAYVSSIWQDKGVRMLQLDGSVNSGNSGGPLVDVKSGRVAGIITRALTGVDLDPLIRQLQRNQALLAPKGSSVVLLGGLDPFAAFRAANAAMEKIAIDLRRSANVGIGYAFSSEYVAEAIEQA